MMLRALIFATLCGFFLPPIAIGQEKACPGCCSSHGGISNQCGVGGRIRCNDGTTSPSCLCSSCGVSNPPPAPTTYSLIVQLQGTGLGTISSSPNGIACGQSCSAAYNSGTTVTLTAVPGGNSTFTGWGGQCSGTGSCQLLMFSTRSVTATFTATSTEGGNPAATNYTGLWWNRLESGWGVNFSHQGNLLFATLFTYDQEGTPMWLVMSSGQLQTDGRTFSGDLYATRGPAFNAIPFSPSDVHVERVGSMSVAFANATSAVLAYNVSGVGVTKAIEPQVYGTRRATCRPSTAGTRAGLTNYQDLWWNPLESGWGINITHQDDTIFATLFDYDLSGHGAWYVMSAGVRLADGSYTGDLYRTAGSGFASVPFSLGNVTQVGSMQLRFQDGVTGVLAYSINGAAVTKTIVRQVFAAPGPECSS